ncbi:NAD-dependent epimerase/dehydratase family protein [bacterium]|nr:NAD-dependent epimerase/dehydratase family protein [bacterium]
MKALVTGGAGLIGSHLVDLLLERGFEVRILDSLVKPTHLKGKPPWIPKEAEFILGDMRKMEDVDKALEGVDYVFHQAAEGGFMPEVSKYVHANCLGTAILLELIIKKHPVKRLVVASSQAVYGEGKYSCSTHGPINPNLRAMNQLAKREWEVKCPFCNLDLKPLPTDENSHIGAETTYAITKYTQERLVIGLGKGYDIPTVALRYSVTYGPRQSIFNPYTGVCSIFSTRMLNNLPPIVYEDGYQTRDFIYVRDVAEANLLVAEKDEAIHQVFNVGTGEQTTVLKLIQTLAHKYNLEIKSLMKNEFRPGEVRHLFADNSKLKALGWKPKITIEEGVDRYVEWIKTQSDIKEYFTEAEEQLKKMKVVMKT